MIAFIMIIGIGIDMVDLVRFKKVVLTKNFLDKYFSFEERDLNTQSLAGRFAAREAFFKALDKKELFKFSEIKIVNAMDGHPMFILSGRIREHFIDKTVQLSISHTTKYAVSFVIIESNN
jgi:holo-[acyl-carrier protein] synthase